MGKKSKYFFVFLAGTIGRPTKGPEPISFSRTLWKELPSALYPIQFEMSLLMANEPDDHTEDDQGLRRRRKRVPSLDGQ